MIFKLHFMCQLKIVKPTMLLILPYIFNTIIILFFFFIKHFPKMHKLLNSGSFRFNIDDIIFKINIIGLIIITKLTAYITNRSVTHLFLEFLKKLSCSHCQLLCYKQTRFYLNNIIVTSSLMLHGQVHLINAETKVLALIVNNISETN